MDRFHAQDVIVTISGLASQEPQSKGEREGDRVRDDKCLGLSTKEPAGFSSYFLTVILVILDRHQSADRLKTPLL